MILTRTKKLSCTLRYRHYTFLLSYPTTSPDLPIPKPRLIVENIYFLPYRIPSTDWIIASTSAKTAAAQKPLVANPTIKLSVILMMRTLITKATIPSVSQFSGAVINLRTAPSVAFRTPHTTATMSAVTTPSILTPGTRYAAASTAQVDKRREMRNFIKKKS